MDVHIWDRIKTPTEDLERGATISLSKGVHNDKNELFLYCEGLYQGDSMGPKTAVHIKGTFSHREVQTTGQTKHDPCAGGSHLIKTLQEMAF